MAFTSAGRAVSSQTHFVNVFRSKLLQLQRGGRIASRTELEREGREGALAQGRDSLPWSTPGWLGP